MIPATRQFTIILPTTKDRGLLLPLVVKHMQMQRERDWELFIIGDGVHADTRQVARKLCADDARIRFFDHPKHPRRGEPYRHQALAEARGRNVAYSCDRDLWLPDHLQRLGEALADADWAHTRRLSMTAHPTAPCILSINCDLANSRQRAHIVERECCIGLSCVGHTLAAYRRLPWGWRETPAGIATDRYMWMQFLSDPSIHTRSIQWPTVLYFNRGSHPGLSTALRHAELALWVQRLPDVAALNAFRADQLARLERSPSRLQHALRSWFWWRPRWAARVYPFARRVPHGVDLLGLRRG